MQTQKTEIDSGRLLCCIGISARKPLMPVVTKADKNWDSYWDTFLAFRTLRVALAGLDVLDKDPRLVFVAPRPCSRSILLVASRTYMCASSQHEWFSDSHMLHVGSRETGAGLMLPPKYSLPFSNRLRPRLSSGQLYCLPDRTSRTVRKLLVLGPCFPAQEKGTNAVGSKMVQGRVHTKAPPKKGRTRGDMKLLKEVWFLLLAQRGAVIFRDTVRL